MKGLTFSQFMIEGGLGMWPVLLFGLVTLGASIRFAIRPSPRWLAFTGAMVFTVSSAIMHAMLMNVSAVFRFLENNGREGEVVRILFAGLKESSRPGALGGIFVTLAALCVAVGVFRARWGEGP